MGDTSGVVVGFGNVNFCNFDDLIGVGQPQSGGRDRWETRTILSRRTNRAAVSSADVRGTDERNS